MAYLLNVARMILKALRDLFVGNDDNNNNNNNNNNGGDGNNNNGGDDRRDTRHDVDMSRCPLKVVEEVATESSFPRYPDLPSRISDNMESKDIIRLQRDLTTNALNLMGEGDKKRYDGLSDGYRRWEKAITARMRGGTMETTNNRPVLQFRVPHSESRRTPSRIFTLPYARDVLGLKTVVVGRFGVDRRGAERVEASLQRRFMSRRLGHRLYRGTTAESNLIPEGEYFVENVVFITYLDKTIVDEKIANGEIVVVP
ncbi:hypothetical protein NFJ02_12g11430 [Pycnococcus provasolii]